MNPLVHSLIAQEQAPAGPAGGASGPAGCEQAGSMLVPILLMFAIIYFLIIRPQQKQQKKHQALLQSLKKGDRVVTNSGFFGTIVNMTDAIVTLELAKNTHVRMLRGQIAGLQPGEITGTDAAPVVPEPDKQ